MKRGVRVTVLIGRRSEENMRRSSERTDRFMARLLHGAIIAAFVMLFLVCGVLFGGGR